VIVSIFIFNQFVSFFSHKGGTIEKNDFYSILELILQGNADMGIFDFLLGKDDKIYNETYRFGRFLECNKPAVFTKIYNEATDHFKQGRYADSFVKFLDYLATPPENNVTFKRSGDSVEFSITHGSAVITGTFDSNGTFATSEIGEYSGRSAALFRDLLTKNFSMNYCCFCAKNNRIYLKHISPLKESSPLKLYYAIKEMALKADIHSQSLFDDFNMLHESSQREKKEATPLEKTVKIKYLRQWINDTFNATSSMSPEKDANLMSHYLLALCYRIDFLLLPRGKVWKINDSAIAIYSDKVLTQSEKIRKMISFLKDILDLSDADMNGCFFKTVDTFGLVNGSTQNDLVQFLLDQFNSAKYYSDLNQEKNTIAVYEQALGYTTYFLGIYPAVRSLLTLYYRIFYPGFFNELGIKSDFYDAATGKFNKRAIENEIQSIIGHERKLFPSLNFITYNLRYESPSRFAFTFLNEITYLNFLQPAK